MPISINTNTLALEAARNLDLTSASFTRAVQRLSSGLRINSAADDPSGLGVSQKLIAQINGFDQAQRNTQDAVSLLQSAQAGLSETMIDLQRLNELGLRASNGTLTSSDRLNIQLEVQGLLQDIDRVAQQTKYNGQALLNGSLGASATGGGPDITDLRVQAGTAAAGTYTLSAATPATKSAVQGNLTGAATFQGGGSITIVGPTSQSATFTSFAGEAVSDFIQQVNNAGLGVTLAVTGGRYLLASNNNGINNGSNPTGPTAVTVTGDAANADFGTGGAGTASLGLIGGMQGSVDNTGTFTGGAGTVVNGSVTFGGVNVALTGPNSDQFAGKNAVAGISFRVVNPGSIGTTDSVTVKQNSPVAFEVGASGGQTVGLAIDAQTSLALGVNAIDVTTQTSAEATITAVQTAISQVSAAQSNLGALQNVLTNVQNLSGAQELNARTANSNLVDANITQETVNFTRDQILLQAGTAVLAQANQSRLGLLGLFSSGGPLL
ncbi:MAG TPA: flagellin [Chloroflexota bacterium]|nr:flagellin [Chloroflexota bacterium]